MPIATKRKVEEKKSAPIIEAEPAPLPLQEEQAAAPKVTALIFSYDSAPAYAAAFPRWKAPMIARPLRFW